LKLRTIHLLTFGCLLCLFTYPAGAAPNSGRISGVVVDSSGTPQMGAAVFVSSEELFNFSSIQIRTNERGRFSTAALSPGIYSIKVTLAGFLPAMDQHIEVNAQGATLLQIVLGSVFSSLEQLRKKPNQRVSSDDWAWVLRGSAGNRSVLQWQDPTLSGQPDPLDTAQDDRSHGQFELSSGAVHPGSIANLADSPSTAFAYEMGIGLQAHLLMAGQISYEGAEPSASIASEWLPSGKTGVGPATTLVVRESHLGPEGPIFRGLRLSHDDEIALTDRVSVRYGGEYIYAGFGGATSTLRPRAEVEVLLAPDWAISGTVAERPWEDATASETALQSTLDALDTFPVLMMRHGRPLFENNLHEELSLNHSIGAKATLSAAVFHDGDRHTAVIGQGPALSPDFVQDYFSEAFAYDGGHSQSIGTRLAYQQKITDDVETVFVYAYGGALAPTGELSGHALREQLATKDRQSLAARISTSVPVAGTKLSVGYKWISGAAVSQQDVYGESLYDISPYLNVQLRQPLPGAFTARHLALQADFGNLLAQGYVPMVGTHSKQYLLVPAYRYFRGGLSFQF